MDICQSLADSVRLELNHIYTERPFQTATGYDMGWFCREHALHLSVLAEMLGHRAQLCCGDIVLNIPGIIKIFTLGSNNDHAWCCINGEAPFDASVTLKYLAPTQTDIRAVCPRHPELLSGIELKYEQGLTDQTFKSVLEANDLLIAYNEKLIVSTNLIELLAEPFDFLHRPAPGNPTFTEIFGGDVFFAITAHLHKLAQGEVKPLRIYRSPKDTVRGIMRHNPEARAYVAETILSSARNL